MLNRPTPRPVSALQIPPDPGGNLPAAGSYGGVDGFRPVDVSSLHAENWSCRIRRHNSSSPRHALSGPKDHPAASVGPSTNEKLPGVAKVAVWCQGFKAINPQHYSNQLHAPQARADPRKTNFEPDTPGQNEPNPQHIRDAIGRSSMCRRSGNGSAVHCP